MVGVATRDVPINGTVNGTVNGTANDTISGIVKNGGVLSPLADKIVEAMIANRRVTYDGLVSTIGMSRQTISRAVKVLLQQGAIRRVGSDKTGYWKVIEGRGK